MDEAACRPIYIVMLFLFAYPGAVHLSVMFANPWPAAVLLTVLCILGLWQAQRSGHRWAAAVGLVLLTGAIWVLAARFELLRLLYWQPILINAAGSYLFARTLAPGQVPLVTRFAAIVRGYLHPDVARYTRRVTQAWALFFAMLALESLLLALFAPVRLWSLFTNFINYLLVAAFFVAEYWVRIRCLAHLEHPGFIKFLRSLLRPELRSQLK